MNPIVDALEAAVPLQGILGYLNFSEGRPDPRVQKQFNDACTFLAERGEEKPWQTLDHALHARLDALRQSGASAFRDIEQARSVLDLVFEDLVPTYRGYHADLLSHVPEADFYQPFFLMRAFEAVLTQRGPWVEASRIVKSALAQLNDFVGHRPLAVLEGRQRGELYPHERVRPIPLFLKGAGIAYGPYAPLVERALEVLAATDKNLLAEVHFDRDLLDELAEDPRAYDFGHPVDKRTNYCFGEWDPHHIDGKGNYRRFVLRRIMLQGLLHRLETANLPREELLFDVGSVLAGTILMASAISGGGPTTHDSTVSLTTLVPRVARARDMFYASLLAAQSGPRAQRLAHEAQVTRQPFGATRQHLNQFLARQRALQIQQRRLALFLAELGYSQAARRQVSQIAVTSARLLTEMHVRLTTGNLLVERGRPDEAAKLLPQIEDLLHRGIACGALVDPWNILGFQGQFPRFVALEDSVVDPRVEELVHTVERLLHLYGRVLGESAAQGSSAEATELARPMRRLADWWDRYATTTVADVTPVNGNEAVESAEHVAQALARWRERGDADLGFWKQHLEGFRSPKSFALVIEALLAKQDFRAAHGLLMTWLSQAEQAPLVEGDHSFHTLALRWMMGVCASSGAGKEDNLAPGTIELVGRFFDHLEANADEYWQVPRLNPLGVADEQAAEAPPPPDDEDSIYGAAYEGVTYKDSTDDDVEGEVLDIMPQKDFDLAQEEERLEKRLQFLSTLARLWNIATRIVRHAPDNQRRQSQDYLRGWLRQARENYRQLQDLLDTLHEHEIPKPSGSFESMVEYEKRRGIKERLLHLSIVTCLDQVLAVGALHGLLADDKPATSEKGKGPGWEPIVLAMERSLLRKEPEQVRVLVGRFLEEFRREPLLYTPLNQGGHPRQVLRASLAQTILRGLAANLPRQGLLRETLDLLHSAREMEKSQQLTGPRVSEFDRLFQLGCQAVVEAVIDSASLPGQEPVSPDRIVETLEKLLEPFLVLWSDHSKNLRLSVLEAVSTDEEWDRLSDFIRRYGRDLFTPRFMAEGNLRGVLHRGVGAYLDYLRDNDEPQAGKLIEDLDQSLPRGDAVRFLHIILQALVDNYAHYQDYKAIATQSDYGDNLYQLLDFIQLKVSYERQAWELRPLNLVHEVLARRHPETADLWRRQIEENTRDWADEHLSDLDDLEQEYGLRLATIRDRLTERFVQPLAIDSLCALVASAAEQARQLDPSADPVVPLEERIRPFAANTTGVGFTLPPWLARLEGELHRLQVQRTALVNLAETLFQVPKVIGPFETLIDPDDDDT